MKRTSMIAAAMGTAAVLGVAGTAMAASAGTSAPATVKVSPTSDDNGLRGDGTVDDNKAKATPSAPSALRHVLNQSDAARAALRVTGGGKDKGSDDHGRGGHGRDDKGSDDPRGGHGGDDKGSDDHGGRGHGSDD